MNEQIQLSFFQELFQKNKLPSPVNVSTIPQRSPFRYPGGKTWFVPTFRQWTKNLNMKSKYLIEPFAGGGIISLTAVFENLVEKAIMVELDQDVSAVWETIVSDECEWLVNKILTFELTIENIKKEISNSPETKRERAFQTILKNRTFHGGILAEGSGLLKYGENGKGIHSRWYPETIAKRIFNINKISDRIDFRYGDGLEILNEFKSKTDAIYFIDPPYTAGGKNAGKRLYKHSILDHNELFQICESLNGDFLMTYDNTSEVKNLARNHSFQMRLIPMKNTHNATKEELVVGRNLSWMDNLREVHDPQLQYNIHGSDLHK